MADEGESFLSLEAAASRVDSESWGRSVEDEDIGAGYRGRKGLNPRTSVVTRTGLDTPLDGIYVGSAMPCNECCCLILRGTDIVAMCGVP